MKILFIDTTTKDMIVAVVTDNDVIDASLPSAGTFHSEKLCLAVDGLLKKNSLSFSDLDGYACSVGPGSFTGIRIGISTVKGYALACPKPIIAVNCLEAVACSDLLGNKGKAILDAGNGYYFADYIGGSQPKLVDYFYPLVSECATAQNASQYFDGAVKIVRSRFENGNFCENLSAVYIRKSQAEVNAQKTGIK